MEKTLNNLWKKKAPHFLEALFDNIYFRQGEGFKLPERVPQKDTPPPKLPLKDCSESDRKMVNTPVVPLVDSQIPVAPLLS